MDSKIKIGLIGSLIIYYIMNKKKKNTERHEQLIDKGESALGIEHGLLNKIILKQIGK